LTNFSRRSQNSQKIALDLQTETLSLLLTRKAVRNTTKSGLQHARQEIHRFCFEYFQMMTNTNTPEDEILCNDIMKICMGLEKCPAFRGVRSGAGEKGVDSLANVEERNLLMHELCVGRDN